MATSFYQRQADAKKNTSKLVILFVTAVIMIVGTLSAATWYVTETFITPRSGLVLGNPAWYSRPSFEYSCYVGLGSAVLIFGGSFFKIFELRQGGGKLVAESLGGKRISPSSAKGDERKLMNIVEEMAIASGVPVPPVFLMNEDGINAFAAGYSPKDAVLGVTRGCISKLNRSELQGVIAHEFSHILNGDMRMNIKLIGVLHGILLIGLTGHMILRGLFYSGGSRSRRSSKDNKGGGGILVLIALACAAIIVGFIGVFFGNLIKAAVSRQREFLADASAVQFTRDPGGISGALQRIGGYSTGSRLENSNVSEASHMFFSQAIYKGLDGLLATHPPLDKRIRAIDPSWGGKFSPVAEATGQGHVSVSTAAGVTSGFAGSTAGTTSPQPSTSGTQEAPLESIHRGLDTVGEPTAEHQEYAAELITSLPAKLLDSVREPYSARAVIFCLMMDSDLTIRATQMKMVRNTAGHAIHELAYQLMPSIDALAIQKRLPVIDLSLASLKSLSKNQYKEFIQCFNQLIKADNKIDLFEWIMIQVISKHLKPHFEAVKPRSEGNQKLRKMREQCQILLSAISAAGNDADAAKLAYQAGSKKLKDLQLDPLPKSKTNLKELATALSRLEAASASDRRRLIQACAVSVEVDEHITWQEAELLRGVADLLDCPIPPILAT
ncbi:MAG: M48 family metallopeptidase [Planctomycetota bacterium]|nr:M48 family metallopeptidase [Planctomycetota bacterium]